MSKPAIAFVAVVAVAAGGYSAVWFQKAAEFKENFAKSVADINASMKPMMKNGDFFRYESAETSGFPLAMKLSVSKPVMEIPLGAVLRAAPKEALNGEVSPDFEWVEELSLGEGISLASDVMGSKFTLSVNGDLMLKSTTNGTVRHTLAATSATPFICELHTKPSGFLVSYPKFKDAESFFEAFENISCASNQSTLKDASNGTPLASTDKHSLSLRNVTSAGQRSAALKYEIVNSEYLPAGDMIMNNYVAIVSEAMKKPPQTIPYKLSEFGKNNFKIDMSYEGPDNTAAIDNPLTSITLDINSIDINSTVFNSNSSIHMKGHPEGDSRRIIVKADSKTTVSERYDQILSESIKNTLNELANVEGKTGKDLDIAQSIQKFGSIDSLVDAAVPKLHPQGEIVLSADIDLLGKKGAESSDSIVKVGRLDLYTSLYGIKSKGDFASAQAQPPKGNADITCVSCDTLVDDITNYAIRFANYMNAVSPQSKVPVPSAQLASGIKTFIRSLSLNGSDPNAKDLNIQIAMMESGDFTVSGKPGMEALQGYMTHVAPHLPQEPPPQIPPEQMPPEFREQLQNVPGQ